MRGKRATGLFHLDLDLDLDLDSYLPEMLQSINSFCWNPNGSEVQSRSRFELAQCGAVISDDKDSTTVAGGLTAWNKPVAADVRNDIIMFPGALQVAGFGIC